MQKLHRHLRRHRRPWKIPTNQLQQPTSELSQSKEGYWLSNRKVRISGESLKSSSRQGIECNTGQPSQVSVEFGAKPRQEIKFNEGRVAWGDGWEGKYDVRGILWAAEELADFTERSLHSPSNPYRNKNQTDGPPQTTLEIQPRRSIYREKWDKR